MEVIGLEQMNDDGNTRAIVRVKVPPGTWERITKRILPKCQTDEPDDCWLDLYTDDGDTLISDSPFVMRAHHGLWLAKDFFGLPKSDWSKIRGAE